MIFNRDLNMKEVSTTWYWIPWLWTRN